MTKAEKEYIESNRLYKENLKRQEKDRKYWREWAEKVLAALNDIQDELKQLR